MEEKELLKLACNAGLNFTTAKLFAAYVIKREFNTKGSFESWLKRFKEGTEWQLSDYSGRRVLRDLSVVYPENLDDYHGFN